ncbi:hypothetical protein I7I51_02444 [Histoplasma capsulatum]|uniref:Uncharacterized protein n=1 Tax=Ajellomyces capsulatus TaxID=5037 RepID=A0A8A1MAA4_AJECA|nr:hypothetical protein I7I51_02444 [Histoplasma capsulatum]
MLVSPNVNPSSYIETCVPQQTGLSQPSQSHRPALPPSDADGTLPERPEQQLPGYQTGRVFELTLHDVQAILMSGQAGSKVWLTETIHSHRKSEEVHTSFLHISASSPSVDDFDALIVRSILKSAYAITASLGE